MCCNICANSGGVTSWHESCMRCNNCANVGGCTSWHENCMCVSLCWTHRSHKKIIAKKLQKVLTSENNVLLWLHQMTQHKETQDDQGQLIQRTKGSTPRRQAHDARVEQRATLHSQRLKRSKQDMQREQRQALELLRQHSSAHVDNVGFAVVL